MDGADSLFVLADFVRSKDGGCKFDVQRSGGIAFEHTIVEVETGDNVGTSPGCQPSRARVKGSVSAG